MPLNLNVSGKVTNLDQVLSKFGSGQYAILGNSPENRDRNDIWNRLVRYTASGNYDPTIVANTVTDPNQEFDE